MDSWDFSTDNSSSTIGSTLGIGTTAFAAGLSEAVTDNYSGTGFVDMGDETSAGTDSAMDAADGNTLGLTTVGGLLTLFSGSSSAGPDIILRTENKKAYSTVEKKAKEIYDEYDKKHIKENESGATLLTESPEIANALNEVLSGTKSKYELLHQLELLEKIVIENREDEKSKQIVFKRNK